jgi:hypothetical protein
VTVQSAGLAASATVKAVAAGTATVHASCPSATPVNVDIDVTVSNGSAMDGGID